LWRLGASDLLVEDRLLDQGGAPPAVLLRPGHARPAGLVELALPVAAEGEAGLVALGLASWVVVLQPGTQLVAKGLFLVGQREVHGVRNRSASPTAGRRGDGIRSPTMRVGLFLAYWPW